MLTSTDMAIYRADYPKNAIDRGFENLIPEEKVYWLTPLFMPKMFARIWLEITGIRVERVQEITEGDAVAEGMAYISEKAREYRAVFAVLWNKLNGRRKGVYKRIDGKRKLVGFICYPWAKEDALPIPTKAKKLGLPCTVIANPWVRVLEVKRIQR